MAVGQSPLIIVYMGSIALIVALDYLITCTAVFELELLSEHLLIEMRDWPLCAPMDVCLIHGFNV